MESANIIPVTIEDEMRGSYLDYAMSVIISRALPDARDGLKPVHRRVLYAMMKEGLGASKKYSKCAGVVGEVLKKYHPHGDSAVYNALVRMAQSWSLRYPLIDGQGNFGSIDGDSPAAYRYTECRLQKITESLLADIEKETVDFQVNFDDTTQEPIVLPSRIPSLLVNGGEGIAVGMASKIPPHNLTEIVNAAQAFIENPEITDDDLISIVPGPDFPTGGVIYGSAVCKQLYKTGRGTIKIRGVVHTETLKRGSGERTALIIDEIPYQVNKSRLVERMAELVREKRIEGISQIRDESDRNGMRVVVELKRDATDSVVLNQLFKLTPLQESYGATIRAIVDGRPQILTLRKALSCFIDHRREVVTRRAKFDLHKAKSRLHILEGFKIALDNIEEVIKLIRASDSTAKAKVELKSKFGLSDIQATQILDMPLKRLTGLERQAIEEEYKQLVELIEELEKLLSDSALIDNVVKTELGEILEQFGDERRTAIEESDEEIDLEDLIEEQQQVVTLSNQGYVKRCSPDLYRAQGRGGKGVQATKKLENEDFTQELFLASTHAYLLIFTNFGKLHWVKVYRLPEGGRTARGRALVNMVQLADGEKVQAVQAIRNFDEDTFVVLLTKQGLIKRVDAMQFSNVRKSGIKALSLEEGDEVVSALITDGNADIMISTSSGMAIRFEETQIRSMGRTAKGVKGVSLSEGDQVVSCIKVTDEVQYVLSVSELGYGKRTTAENYRTQGRGGKGLIDIKTEGRNGEVVSSIAVTEHDEVMIITSSGKIIRTPVEGISVVGRNTLGVRLINLDEGEKVTAVTKIVGEEEECD